MVGGLVSPLTTPEADLSDSSSSSTGSQGGGSGAGPVHTQAGTPSLSQFDTSTCKQTWLQPTVVP